MTLTGLGWTEMTMKLYRTYYVVDFAADFILTHGTLKYCNHTVDSSAGGRLFIVKKNKLTYRMQRQVAKWNAQDSSENYFSTYLEKNEKETR